MTIRRRGLVPPIIAPMAGVHRIRSSSFSGDRVAFTSVYICSAGVDCSQRVMQ